MRWLAVFRVDLQAYMGVVQMRKAFCINCLAELLDVLDHLLDHADYSLD